MGVHIHPLSCISMKSPGIFLTAEWKNLVMLNYAVNPSLLTRFVPAALNLIPLKESRISA